MKERKMTRIVAATVAVLLASSVWPRAGSAQYVEKWLDVGSLQQFYAEAGGEWDHSGPNTGMEWPGILQNQDHFVRKALWIGVKDFTDEDGKDWSHKVAHIGPRTAGVDEFFPVKFEMHSRFEPPEVTVDGFETFKNPVFVEQVDPSMKADRKIVNVSNSVTGITMRREIRQFSESSHDNYHIIEHTFTNTGNVDGDEDIELPDQTLEGVYIFMEDNYQVNAQFNSVMGSGVGWGRPTMMDVVGDDKAAADPYDYDVDLRARFGWLGNWPPFTQYNTIGGPVWDNSGWAIQEGDTTGRLVASEFVGRATVHADRSAADDTNDPGQPSMTGYLAGGADITHGYTAFNEAKMAQEYRFMSTGEGTRGGSDTHFADIVAPPSPEYPTWHERMANQTSDPSYGEAGGYKGATSYGPYKLEPGESIRVVEVEAVNGLSMEADLAVGKAYKRSGGDDDQLIAFDANGDGQIGPDEEMTKNMWVMTSRDSLFKSFERAIANYESGYAIPHPPQPPKEFHVFSGPDKITLEWSLYDGADPQGFEVYRARNRYEGAAEDDFQYELIAELDPGERQYEDSDVTRGISYFYYIQSVGEVNTDDTGMTPTGLPLKSSRYYTQTYDPAQLTRPPGSSLEAARIVPNPYTLASDPDVRWPDQQDKVGFLNIPGKATIKIYSERGNLVETIEHTDGSGDEYWDLTTSSHQLIVSGIYLVVIEDEDTGEQVVKKFIAIR